MPTLISISAFFNLEKLYNLNLGTKQVVDKKLREPIMNKAHEGLAEQVQAKAVVQAMEQVRSRHAFASKQAKTITNDKAKINQMATILAGSMAAGRYPYQNFIRLNIACHLYKDLCAPLNIG